MLWAAVASDSECAASGPPLLSGILAPSRQPGITCYNCAVSLLLCGSGGSADIVPNPGTLCFGYLGNALLDAFSNLTPAFCCAALEGGRRGRVGWTFSGFGYFKRVHIPHGDTLDKMVPLQKRVI